MQQCYNDGGHPKFIETWSIESNICWQRYYEFIRLKDKAGNTKWTTREHTERRHQMTTKGSNNTTSCNIFTQDFKYHSERVRQSQANHKALAMEPLNPNCNGRQYLQYLQSITKRQEAVPVRPQRQMATKATFMSKQAIMWLSTWLRRHRSSTTWICHCISSPVKDKKCNVQ